MSPSDAKTHPYTSVGAVVANLGWRKMLLSLNCPMQPGSATNPKLQPPSHLEHVSRKNKHHKFQSWDQVSCPRLQKHIDGSNLMRIQSWKRFIPITLQMGKLRLWVQVDPQILAFLLIRVNKIRTYVWARRYAKDQGSCQVLLNLYKSKKKCRSRGQGTWLGKQSMGGFQPRFALQPGALGAQ